MMDLRPKAFVRTKAGNKNMIRLFLALESLYTTEFLDYERSQQKQKQKDKDHQYSSNYYYS